MSLRLKLAGIGLGTLLALALSAWAWSLWTWKRGAQLTLAESQKQVETAQAQVEAVQRDLNAATTTITELKARKPGERVVIKNVPAPCLSCLENYRISTTTASARGWWSYTDPDVLDDKPGELVLTPKFWTDTVGPYKAAVEDCQKRLKNGPGKPRLLRKGLGLAVEGFYSLEGPGGAVEWTPIEIGGTAFSIMPLGRAGYANGVPGLVDARLQVLVGLRLEIGRPR